MYRSRFHAVHIECLNGIIIGINASIRRSDMLLELVAVFEYVVVNHS